MVDVANRIDAEVFGALRAAVRSILEYPVGREWSVQGFGMLRTYFGRDKKYRLNIWDSALAVPDVSILHDHPWDFRSWIIAGLTCNVRFKDWTKVTPRAITPCDTVPLANGSSGLYDWMVIKTGEGGGPDGKNGTMPLLQLPQEFYEEGMTYHQVADEIHASYYRDGTVTLNDRVRRLDGEHARVFWPHGQNWVDAEPRPAQLKEIRRTVEKALAGFPTQTEL